MWQLHGIHDRYQDAYHTSLSLAFPCARLMDFKKITLGPSRHVFAQGSMAYLSIYLFPVLNPYCWTNMAAADSIVHQPVTSAHLFMFLCHLPMVVTGVEPRQVVSGRTSRAILSPRCPIKSRSTAQMLYRHFGFQEIISDWEGQHPVGLGEPLILFVWLPMLCIICLSVLASAYVSQTWSLDGRTHHSHRPQESTAVSQ